MKPVGLFLAEPRAGALNIQARPSNFQFFKSALAQTLQVLCGSSPFSAVPEGPHQTYASAAGRQ